MIPNCYCFAVGVQPKKFSQSSSDTKELRLSQCRRKWMSGWMEWVDEAETMKLDWNTSCHPWHAWLSHQTIFGDSQNQLPILSVDSIQNEKIWYKFFLFCSLVGFGYAWHVLRIVTKSRKWNHKSFFRLVSLFLQQLVEVEFNGGVILTIRLIPHCFVCFTVDFFQFLYRVVCTLYTVKEIEIDNRKNCIVPVLHGWEAWNKDF